MRTTFFNCMLFDFIVPDRFVPYVEKAKELFEIREAKIHQGEIIITYTELSRTPPQVEQFYLSKAGFYQAITQEVGHCQHCPATEDLTVHHILRIGTYGDGTNDFSNLIVLCRKCHDLVHGF